MSKKIVFMGTPKFSVETLKILADSHYDIACVYTQPAKKSLRGQRINESAVQKVARELKLNFRCPVNLNNKEEYDYFKSLNPYIVIVVAYGKIIPKNYLNIPNKGFINIHASLLPKWRGAAPIQRSIMSRDQYSGISIMQIKEDLDVGPIMRQIKVKIEEQTTTKILSDKLSELGAKNILDCISTIEKEKANFIDQEHSEATYAKKINKLESQITWKEKAENVLAKINALNPSPGSWFELNNVRYKIWKAEVCNDSGEPGKVIDKNLIVACKEKSIKILEIQREGKNKLLINDFLSGTNIAIGSKIS